MTERDPPAINQPVAPAGNLPGPAPEERIQRILTLRPEDLSRWTRLCRALILEVRQAHPNYPPLTEMQLLSYVKRLLPRIRTMMNDPP